MKFYIFPSLIMAIALAGCGGGSSSDSPAPAAQPSQPSQPSEPPQPSQPSEPETTQTLSSVPQIIEIYGDSTIRGLKCFDGFAADCDGTTVATTAPEAFEQALPASPRHTVRNLGVDNQTACDVSPNWANTMASSDATVVIVNHGINDSRDDVGESIAEYKACLTNIARTTKSAGKRLIFETPNPVANDTIDDYALAMQEVAAQEALPVIDQYAELMTYLAGQDVRQICPDGTHPSQEIYVRKGEYAARVFAAIPL